MSFSDSLNTHGLLQWVSELQAGRTDGAEPEFQRILARVERMTRTAFKRYARIGRFVEPDDVVQNTMLRLLAAFRQMRPTSTCHFYALTNELIRREYLDLIRANFGPAGQATQVQAVSIHEMEGELDPPALPQDPQFDEMVAFHETLAKLPAEEREVMGLAYYHGWTQAQIAELFNVSVRTVQRWQVSAVERLRRQIGEKT